MPRKILPLSLTLGWLVLGISPMVAASTGPTGSFAVTYNIQTSHDGKLTSESVRTTIVGSNANTVTMNSQISRQGHIVTKRYVIPTKNMIVTLPGQNHGVPNQQNVPSIHGRGRWNINQSAKFQGGLVKTVHMNATGGQPHHSFNLVVNLVKSSGTLPAIIRSDIGKNHALWLVPQLLPPVASRSTGARVPTQPDLSLSNSTLQPAIVGGGGGGVGAIAYLYERDNTIANWHLWHLGANLEVSSFTTGPAGWSARIDALATSPAGNWWKQGQSVNSSANSSNTAVTETTTASFLGIFPLANYDTWIAVPEVKVTAYNTGVTTGYINDSILAYNSLTNQWVPWSDTIPLNSSFPGYYSVIKYVV